MGAAERGVKSLADPASFFSGEKQDVGGFFDPGSRVIGGFFGEEAGEIAGKIADPLGILPEPVEFGETPTIEQFIRERSPQAIAELTRAAEEAARLSGTGTQAAISELQPFTGTQAFREQAAILGALGPEAQQSALAGIPVSEADIEQQELERRRLLRQAAAAGRLGAGSTVSDVTELAAQQRARQISDRLAALSPVSDITRTAASTISGLGEADIARQAQILAGLGPQQAQILLGGAADIAGARSAAAELAGLQDIARGQQIGGIAGQLGQAFASRPQTQTVPQVQAGTSTIGTATTTGQPARIV